MRYFFYSLFFITEAFGASSPEPKLRDIKEFEASLDPFFIASCIFFALIVLFFLFKLFRRYFLKKKRGGLELEETLEDSLRTLSKYVNTDRFNDEARLFLNHFCYVVSSKDISFFTDNELVEYLKNNSLLSEKVLSNSQKVLGIKSLAKKYNNVHILGYVEDLNPLFSSCDLQIVGSQFSTGIRTRIIESFVRGLPVISTHSAARGLHGLEDKKNIYLADKPDHVKNIIESIFMDRNQLEIISKNSRLLYEKEYSRKIQTERLKQYIFKYII